MPERIRPLPLVKQSKPFDDSDWLFEIKYDGFRSLAFIGAGTCQLVSRKGHRYDRFRSLTRALSALPHEPILDGEIACIDETGVSQFDDLYFANRPALFFAFDILALDGNDLREAPCVDRKQILRDLVDERTARLHYVDHIEQNGIQLFDMICERDMEGIVAKPKSSPYRLVNGKTPWIKIKNPGYTQAEDRGELFHPTAKEEESDKRAV